MKHESFARLPIEGKLDAIYNDTTRIMETVELILNSTRESQVNRYLNSSESAEYLGIRINTLYRYSSKGLIKPNHPSGRLMFTKAELDEFIKSNPKRRRSKREIEQEAEAHAYKLRKKSGKSNILVSF